MSFFKTVEKRRSVRSFSKKPVEKSKIQKILRTAWMSPSAMGMQNFKIFVVEEQKKKEKLVK
ncbi:MAG: nitroreductase family protein, partial [Nitrosopumilus sp.]|nr:nitroreductase family protein [Nitrosopumilus sp.]